MASIIACRRRVVVFRQSIDNQPRGSGTAELTHIGQRGSLRGRSCGAAIASSSTRKTSVRSTSLAPARSASIPPPVDGRRPPVHPSVGNEALRLAPGLHGRGSLIQAGSMVLYGDTDNERPLELSHASIAEDNSYFSSTALVGGYGGASAPQSRTNQHFGAPSCGE
jgi:hypothetical protein